MVEYFDDAKKAKWRAEHPNLPDPLVWCRDATKEESPGAAWRALVRVRKLGWTATLTYACGHHADDDGFPEHETVKVYLFNDDNTWVLTPTGRQAYQEEKTDALVVVESVALRAEKDDRWLRAVWNRSVVPDRKWTFWKAFAHQRIMNSAQMNKYIVE